MSFSSMLGSYKTAAKPQKRAANDGDDRHAKRPAVGAADASAAAPPKPPPRVAVMCMARDEATFFPIWLRYYSSQGFAPEDIYVLDHLTRDGSLDAGHDLAYAKRDGRDVEESVPPGHALARAALNGARFVRARVACFSTKTGDEFLNNDWRVRCVASWTAGLIAAGYHAVIFTDTDEIVVADPARWPSLHAYATEFAARHRDERGATFKTSYGYEARGGGGGGARAATRRRVERARARVSSATRIGVGRWRRCTTCTARSLPSMSRGQSWRRSLAAPRRGAVPCRPFA